MKRSVTIIDALHHPKIWATPAWRPDPTTWVAWDAFHKAVHGLLMTEAELDIFRGCTARPMPQPGGHQEVVAIISRRGGKTLNMAQEAVYLACFREWPGAAGERKIVLVCAATAKQGRNVFSYCRRLIVDVAPLKMLLERETASELELTNGITIEIVVNDYRSIRGATIVAAVCDEVAFWNVDGGANPDKEVLAAIRPAMASVAGSMLFIISSPYAKRGVLWDLYRRHYGVENSRVLVWKAATRTMHPCIDQRVVDEAMEADPQSARSEFLGEFRDDISAYVGREIVEAAVVTGRTEVAPGSMGGLINVSAHVDAAGGAGRDSFTMSVSGKDPTTEKAILLCAREVRPPFSPENVAAEYAALIRSYGLSGATADKFAGSWPAEQFAKHGVTLRASKTSSEIFIDFLPLLMSKRVELLDNPTVIAQICGLDRTVGRGRDYIAAGGSGHDDVALAVAGSLVAASRAEDIIPICIPFIADDVSHPRWDRWAPNWSGGAPMPYGGGDGLERDEHVGTLRWQNDLMRRRGEIQ